MSNLSKYRHTILGECLGMGFYPRGLNDNHVCIDILTEDDENWFMSQNGFSSFWLPDLQAQIYAAGKWLMNNCDPDVVHEIQYGWKFRD